MSSLDPELAVAGVSCDIVAQASSRVTAAELPGLRKSPGKLGGEPLSNGLLRHVDEQTVVGVAAILKAVVESGLDPAGFDRWSVLAAPRFLGRAKFESSFPQYRDEGAWGVSPHLVPSHSLHSLSGTISQVLHAHGPNLGIGGTPDGEREALLVAATWLEAGWAEGIWMVLTSRDPEPSGEVAVSESGDYRALAFALVGSRPEFSGRRLKISPQAITIEASEDDFKVQDELLDWLPPSANPQADQRSNWRVDAGHPSTPVPRTGRNIRTRERT